MSDTTEARSLAEAYPEEQARLRTLIGYAREIGPAGAFYIAICEQALREADEAAMSGDLARMVRAYNAMREIEE